MRCTIQDLDRVNAILRHPSIYPHIIDDGCPSADEFSAEHTLSCESINYLMPVDGVLFAFNPINSVLYDMHFQIVPELRRKDENILFAWKAMAWMFTQTSAMKIISSIPSINEKALKFALRIGMHPEGHIKRSFLLGGTLHDLLIFGISGGDLCRGFQQQLEP